MIDAVINNMLHSPCIVATKIFITVSLKLHNKATFNDAPAIIVNTIACILILCRNVNNKTDYTNYEIRCLNQKKQSLTNLNISREQSRFNSMNFSLLSFPDARQFGVLSHYNGPFNPLIEHLFFIPFTEASLKCLVSLSATFSSNRHGIFELGSSVSR